MADLTMRRFQAHCVFWTPVIATISIIALMSTAVGTGVGLGVYYINDMAVTLEGKAALLGQIDSIVFSVLTGALVAGILFYPMFMMLYEDRFGSNVVTKEMVPYTNREIKRIVDQYTYLHKPALNVIGADEQRKAYIKDQTQIAINQRDNEPEYSHYWRRLVRVEQEYTKYELYRHTAAAIV